MRHKEAQKRPSICASTMSSAQYLNTCCKAFFFNANAHPPSFVRNNHLNRLVDLFSRPVGPQGP